MLKEKPPIISEKLHDLMHALVMVEKYHDEEQRWLEIVNKLVNEMVLNGNNVDNNIVGSIPLGDFRQPTA